MGTKEISFEKFLLVLSTRAPLIAGAVVMGLAIAGVYAYFTPKVYTATTTLNFNFTGNPEGGEAKSVLLENTYISTQIGIMESRRVGQRVEGSLSDYERSRLISALEAERSVVSRIRSMVKKPFKWILKGGKDSRESAGGGESLQIQSAYGWLASSIVSKLSVQPMFNSRLVAVSYTTTDPKISALMANRISEAYISTNLEMITDPAHKSKAWFDDQLKSLRGKLEDAQAQLTKYQQKHGIVSSDERLDTEISRLKELSSQLVVAQQATRNAVTEQQKLHEVLESGVSLMTFTPVFENSIVQRIKAEIRDLEGQRVQYVNSLGKNHPRMIKIESELVAARQRLENEIQTISDGIDNLAELSRERARGLAQAVKDQEQIVLDLKNEHDQIAILEREVESTRKAYNAALNQLNTTSLQSMIENTSVSIVDAANIPRTHSSPRVTLNLVLGVLAGLLLGVGLAFFMEVFMRRVYSRDDLISELGVPMLGHLKKS